MENVLEVRGVSKSFGTTSILRDVHFTVPRGTIATVTGRSGSGKSTLFKLLAGLDRPTRGEILVEGSNIATLDDARMSDVRLRRIGLVFQSFNLLPDLTVLENVRLPMDIAGKPRREAKRRAEELLDLVHIAPLADKLPNVLSGGETQRTAIARALANDPAILLADEPTGSLDAANAENVLRVFEEINKELGTTVLVVTHDALAVGRFARSMTLADGAVAWKQASSSARHHELDPAQN
ncbi:MAG: ABC transporter ATP-binding protein [Candidatus Thermoplasmatota archaeon]